VKESPMDHDPSKKPDVLTLFRDAAFEVSGRRLDRIGLTTAIAELAMDSVQILEIVAYLEERTEVRLSDDDLTSVTTLADLGALLERASRRAA